ncbi:hypothetical protein [Nonomuraea sp. NPDC050691]|uniref:hypothetical protein n=1 Tax=Nonomuraea sp. NPDC050691 TaxID=3155661 RepID=UPI0033FEAE91
MMYGPDHPGDYPRASSSPTVILLVSGLTGLVGFVLGYVMGFGATETAAEPLPRMTVRMEPPSEPTGQSPIAGSPFAQSPFAQSPFAQSPFAQSPFAESPSVPSPGTPPSGAPLAADAPAAPSPGAPLATAFRQEPAGARRTLVVGVDIQPGAYRTSGPVEGQPMCYWARLRSTAARADDVITADMPRGPATVVIAPTDKAFQTFGCAGWSPA